MNPRQALNDLRVALALLTRLPLPHPAYDPDATRPMARAAWAYPLVGVVVGLAAALVGWGLHEGLNLPAGLAAALCLSAQIIVTGAMHEDGLADCADGFWGAWEAPRRLEIKKDSQIGSYGTLALIASVLLRWYCITLMLGFGSVFLTLIVAGAVSRAAMVVVMQSLPNARAGGLSDQTGRPEWPAAAVAMGITAVLTFCCFSLLIGLAIALVFGLSILCIALLARAKIGGQTGDVLGATQQLTEIGVLIAVITLYGIA